MSITVLQRPAPFSMALNPIVYKFQRKDYAFNQVNAGGGGASQIQFSGVNIASQFTAGDYIYFKSDDGTYNDSSAWVISSVYSAPNTLVEVDTVYSIAGGAGYVNLTTARGTYRLAVSFFNTITNAELFPTAFYHVDPLGGLITADLSVIKTIMDADNKNPLTGYTHNDVEAYRNFYIKYQETWFGGNGSLISESANPIFAVYGALQIPAPGGNNADLYRVPDVANINDTNFTSGWANVPSAGSAWTFTTIEATASLAPVTNSQKAQKTLSIPLYAGITYQIKITAYKMGGNGILWVGFNNGYGPELEVIGFNTVSTTFTLTVTPTTTLTTVEFWVMKTGGLIMEHYVEDISIVKYTEYLTKQDRLYVYNGFELPLSTIIKTGTVKIYPHSLLTNTSSYGTELASFVFAESTYKLFQLNILALTGGYLSDAYEVTIQNLGITVASIIVELRGFPILKIRGNDSYGCNAVLLMGRNSLGGVLEWSFEFNQEQSYEIRNSIAKQRTLFASNLTLNEWEALHDFMSSNEEYTTVVTELLSTTTTIQRRIGQQVYELKSGATKIGLLVKPTKNKTFTRKEKHAFNLEIEYPELFIS
jgi:hypothetical protein